MTFFCAPVRSNGSDFTNLSNNTPDPQWAWPMRIDAFVRGDAISSCIAKNSDRSEFWRAEARSCQSLGKWIARIAVERVMPAFTSARGNDGSNPADAGATSFKRL